VPVLYEALGGEPLTAGQWVAPLMAPFLLLGAEEVRKAIVRRRGRARESQVLQPVSAARQPRGT
jgi:hypothetical protein